MSRPSLTTSRYGTTIAYDCVGCGPALILIEPAGHYRGLSAFDELVPLLSADFTVCRYDRRGRGDSGDTPPYAVEREVEDLSALVNALGGAAFAYGYSSGALLALHAAARGVPFERLVLMEPPLQDPHIKGPDPLTRELEVLVSEGRYEDAVAHFHSAIGVPPDVIETVRGTQRWSRMVAIAPTFVHDCRLSDAMRPDILAAITVPTLILDSEGSTDDLTGSAAAAARLISGAGHVSLPGEWHVVAPALIAREIKMFIKPVAGEAK